jgi:hypothetical protein
MFEDLLRIGYQGSDRTVRDYVRKKKNVSSPEVKWTKPPETYSAKPPE